MEERIADPLPGQLLEQPPYVLRWHSAEQPLPLRPIRLMNHQPAVLPGLTAPPWLDTGPTDQPFDFGGAVRGLCADIVARCGELQHIDASQLLFSVTQARHGQPHGLQARVTPFRFRNGRLARKRRGVVYQVQRYVVEDREILYLMTFCLPRFLDLDMDEKFVTIFHELYHISPRFDGDLRRHDGRYAIHSHSQKEYDRQMAELAREYLASRPDPALHAFLRLDFYQLAQRHGSVIGVMVPKPKVLPVPVQAQG